MKASSNSVKLLSAALVAPAALLLSQGEAKAILNYNIYESAGNLVVQASGSLNLAGAQFVVASQCYNSGTLVPTSAQICTGNDAYSNFYNIQGPSSFNGSATILGGSSSSGISTILVGGSSLFGIQTTYTSSTPIVSSSLFAGQTLAGAGITATGLIGTWTIDGTSESINVYIGAPSNNVPGPLPLLGAGAAFGWSRRLRRRIATPLSTPPLA